MSTEQQETVLPTMKRTVNRVKTSYGDTFLHHSKCVDGNHNPKIYIILSGVRYYLVKEAKGVVSHETEDQEPVYMINLPSDEEIMEIEKDGTPKEMVSETQDQPGIKWHSKYPGRKTKAQFLNPKTGNYVSYIRAVQLKLI